MREAAKRAPACGVEGGAEKQPRRVVHRTHLHSNGRALGSAPIPLELLRRKRSASARHTRAALLFASEQLRDGAACPPPPRASPAGKKN